MINFTKMVGSGNDFIVIDNRKNIFLKNELAIIAKILCNRQNGIGADGLMLIEKPENNTDFRMRIFNADGTEAEMCGNGARCIARFAYDKKIAENKMTFETIAGHVQGFILEDTVKVKLTDPVDFENNIVLDNSLLNLSFINTGVPHAIIFVDDIDEINIKDIGSKICYHKRFSPKGTNVNFVKIVDEHNIIVRTYERGVESETLSCGSGSTASAIISGINKNCKSPVNVKTKSGEILKISFEINNDIINNVFLEGKVKTIFEGSIEKTWEEKWN